MLSAPRSSAIEIRDAGFCQTEDHRATHSITNQQVIVDGNWLAWSLFEDRNQVGQADDSEENLEGYKEQLADFFSEMTNSKVIIVVPSESPHSKNYCLDRRAPSAAINVIRSVAVETKTKVKHLGHGKETDEPIEIIPCYESFYNLMGYLSSQYECPIITGDGIFYARIPKGGVISHYSLDKDVCKIFKLDQLPSCVDLDRKKLGLINSLVRNHFTDHKRSVVTRTLRNRMILNVGPIKLKQTISGRWDGRMLAGIWSHLRYKTYEEVRKFILQLADECSQVTVVTKILDDSLVDLEFDRTARRLRNVLEDLCDCPYHQRIRMANWLEFLHEQTMKPRDVSAAIFKYTRTELIAANEKADDCFEPTKDSRAILLRGLQTSAEKFDTQLGLYCENPCDNVVQEFLTVKLLLSVVDVEHPETIFTDNFKRATLSSIFCCPFGSYSGFLKDFSAKLLETITYFGDKLRIPSETVSECNPSSIRQLSQLIELICTFNELNTLSGNSMRHLEPHKWLNPCLIYNLTENPDILGKQVPEEISDVYGLSTTSVHWQTRAHSS